MAQNVVRRSMLIHTWETFQHMWLPVLVSGAVFTKGKCICFKLRQLQKAICQQDIFVVLSALWYRTSHWETCNAMKYNSLKSCPCWFIIGNTCLQGYKEQPGDTKARPRSQVRLLILDVSNEHRSRNHSNDVTHMSTHSNHLHAINKWMISYKSSGELIVNGCQGLEAAYIKVQRSNKRTHMLI